MLPAARHWALALILQSRATGFLPRNVLGGAGRAGAAGEVGARGGIPPGRAVPQELGVIKGQGLQRTLRKLSGLHLAWPQLSNAVSGPKGNELFHLQHGHGQSLQAQPFPSAFSHEPL